MRSSLICILAMAGLTLMGCSESQFSSTSASTVSAKNNANGITSTDSVLVDDEPTDINAVDAAGDHSCGGGKKVLVCHIPPGNPENKHEICISRNALPAHLGQHNCRHTDYIGTCDQVLPPTDDSEDPELPPEEPTPPPEDPLPPTPEDPLPPVQDL